MNSKQQGSVAFASSASYEGDEPIHQVQFEHVEFDVTPWWSYVYCCPCSFGVTLLAWTNITLILEPEEAVLDQKHICGCCNSTARRPYGELGDVKEMNVCCFVGFGSNLTSQQGDGGGALCPGGGCDTVLVKKIVAELKARMKVRGDTGNIRRIEQVLVRLGEIENKLDVVLEQVMKR